MSNCTSHIFSISWIQERPLCAVRLKNASILEVGVFHHSSHSAKYNYRMAHLQEGMAIAAMPWPHINSSEKWMLSGVTAGDPTATIGCNNRAFEAGSLDFKSLFAAQHSAGSTTHKATGGVREPRPLSPKRTLDSQAGASPFAASNMSLAM